MKRRDGVRASVVAELVRRGGILIEAGRETSGQARGAPLTRRACAPRAGPEVSRAGRGAASERARPALAVVQVLRGP